MTRSETIVRTAQNFLGETEITGNQGFNDQEFENLMEAVGWDKGQAWCAYFCELVWKLSYINSQDIVRNLDLIMSGSAMGTWNGFKKSLDWETSTAAKPGSVVIWQSYKAGKPTWQGHAGIVESVEDVNFTSIEGNTNDGGGREGYIVARKVRKYNFDSTKGLVLKGFVLPREV